MKRQNQNTPSPFQGRMLQEATKPGFSFLCLFCVVMQFLWLVSVCFCCVRFSFCIRSQEIGLRNVSEITYFVLSGTFNLNSMNQRLIDCRYLQVKRCVVLAAPRNADVPTHLYEGRGNVTVEFVPNEVGEWAATSTVRLPNQATIFRTIFHLHWLSFIIVKKRNLLFSQTPCEAWDWKA